MSTIFRSGIPVTALLLGLGGLIPFVGLAAASLLDVETAREPLWRASVMSYGAVILSFVGALHWAFAMTASEMTGPERRGSFTWSVVPALVAWGALLALPFSVLACAAILVACFWAHYLRDRRLARRIDLPLWYLPLRLMLTTIASLSLVAAAASEFI